MRPQGEIRTALRSAFAERGPSTWAEVLPALPVNVAAPSEVRMVRRTVENMVQAGELVRAGHHKVAGSRVWRMMYELAAEPDSVQHAPACYADSLCALEDVTRGWLDR
jgi:hypothetical protein